MSRGGAGVYPLSLQTQCASLQKNKQGLGNTLRFFAFMRYKLFIINFKEQFLEETNFYFKDLWESANNTLMLYRDKRKTYLCCC